MKKKFLVISFDNDEQQWFHDVVFTETSEDALAMILDLRTYCVGAQALDQDEIDRLAGCLRDAKGEDCKPPEVECDICGEVKEVKVLDDSVWCAECLKEQGAEDEKFA